MRGFVWLIVGLFAALTAACADPERYSAPENGAGVDVEELAEGAEAPSVTESVVDDYVLGTGDELNILVFNHPNLSGETTVDSVGNVAVPLLGAVSSSGLTAAQLGGTIERQLRQGGLLRNPQVTVQVLTFRPFYIDGEVENPGSYPYVDGLTVRAAVATAGGYTYRADERRVFITREGESEEQAFPVRVDTAVRPGDQLRVPNRRF